MSFVLAVLVKCSHVTQPNSDGEKPKSCHREVCWMCRKLVQKWLFFWCDFSAIQEFWIKT